MVHLLAQMNAELTTNQAKTDAILKEMKAGQEWMLAKMDSNQEEVKAKMNNNEDKMEAAIRSSQEELRAVISSIWVKLKETMKHQVKDILASLDHKTQGTQVEIEITKPLVDTTWRGLESKIAEVADDFLEERV